MKQASLIDYSIHLADNALILGHRNSEWCGHGPVLEQDIALANISLDLIGQARNFYQYAASLLNDSSTEDTLAYLRDTRDFRNLLLTELPNGDWAQTILRQFFFSAFQYLQYGILQKSSDTQLAAIAAKALKEVTYHLRWSSEWVIRLGDGTAESRRRIEQALEFLWPYTGELFMCSAEEEMLSAETIAVNPSTLAKEWNDRVSSVFEQATLPTPRAEGKETTWMHSGGKKGVHTEHLGYVLAEMQFLQRAYPGAEW